MDLRVAIGGLFAIFGVILTVFGLVSSRAVYAISLGINVNLDWGVVMLVFGLLMLAFGVAGQRQAIAAEAANREPVWPPPSQ